MRDHLRRSRVVPLALCARTPAEARTRSTRVARETRDLGKQSSTHRANSFCAGRLSLGVHRRAVIKETAESREPRGAKKPRDPRALPATPAEEPHVHEQRAERRVVSTLVAGHGSAHLDKAWHQHASQQKGRTQTERLTPSTTAE